MYVYASQYILYCSRASFQCNQSISNETDITSASERSAEDVEEDDVVSVSSGDSVIENTSFIAKQEVVELESGEIVSDEREDATENVSLLQNY